MLACLDARLFGRWLAGSLGPRILNEFARCMTSMVLGNAAAGRDWEGGVDQISQLANPKAAVVRCVVMERSREKMGGDRVPKVELGKPVSRLGSEMWRETSQSQLVPLVTMAEECVTTFPGTFELGHPWCRGLLFSPCLHVGYGKYSSLSNMSPNHEALLP
jgi:hypothetical protein